MTGTIGGVFVGLKATVDASGVVAAEQSIAAATKKITANFTAVESKTKRASEQMKGFESAFRKSGSELKSFVSQQIAAGRTISASGEIITSQGVKAKGLTDEFKRLSQEYENNKRVSNKTSAAMRGIDERIKSIDFAADNAGDELLKLSKEMNRLEKESREAAIAVRATDKAALRMTNTSKGLSNQLVRTNSRVDRSKDTMGGAAKSAGAAGIQFQQFTGQVAGGVNPLIAFSQQAADLGIVMGLPLLGSIVGIAAAIGVVLLPEVFKSTSALEDLEKAMESVAKVASISDDGILTYTDSIRKLMALSKNAAIAELEVGLLRAGKASKAAAVGISDLLGELDADYGLSDIDTFIKALNMAGKSNDVNIESSKAYIEVTTELGELFGKTGKEAQKFGRELVKTTAALEKDPSTDNFMAYQKVLADATAGNTELSSETKEVIASIREMGLEGVKSGEIYKALNAALAEIKSPESSDFDPLTKGLAESQASAQSLAQQVALANAQIDGGSNAARRLALAFELGVGSASQLSDPIKDALSALEAVEQKQADMTAGEKADASNKAALDKKITALRESFKTEAVLRDEAFALDIEAIRAFGLTSEAAKAEADALELARVQAHADALVAVAAAKTAKEQALEKRKSSLIMSMNMATASAAMGLLDEMANGSKAAAIAAIALNKGMAIAKTIQNTGVAVMAAKAVDPSGGLAVKAALMGKAQVAMIAATGLMQAGRSGGASTTGFSGGVPAVNTRQEAQGGGTQNINISGIDKNSLISGGQVVALLNEALGDGVTINFAGG